MNLPSDKYDIVLNPDGSGTFKPKAVDWSEWVPKVDEKYWFIGADGVVHDLAWDGLDFDLALLFQGNVYPTEAMALAALPDIRRAMQIIRACRLVEPDYVPDWTESRLKYCVFESTGVLEVSSVIYNRCTPAYVSTEEKARKVIQILEQGK